MWYTHEQKDYAHALKILHRCTALDSDHHEAHNCMGNIYMLQGNFQLAETEYMSSLQHTTNDMYCTNLFQSLISQSKLIRSTMVFFKLWNSTSTIAAEFKLKHKVNKLISSAKIEKALIKYKKEDIPGAIQLLIKETPLLLEHYVLCKCYYKIDEYEQASLNCNQCMALIPDIKTLYYYVLTTKCKHILDKIAYRVASDITEHHNLSDKLASHTLKCVQPCKIRSPHLSNKETESHTQLAITQSAINQTIIIQMVHLNQNEINLGL